MRLLCSDPQMLQRGQVDDVELYRSSRNVPWSIIESHAEFPSLLSVFTSGSAEIWRNHPLLLQRLLMMMTTGAPSSRPTSRQHTFSNTPGNVADINFTVARTPQRPRRIGHVTDDHVTGCDVRGPRAVDTSDVLGVIIRPNDLSRAFASAVLIQNTVKRARVDLCTCNTPASVVCWSSATHYRAPWHFVQAQYVVVIPSVCPSVCRTSH